MATRLPLEQKRITDIKYFASPEFLRDTEQILTLLHHDSSARSGRGAYASNRGLKYIGTAKNKSKIQAAIGDDKHFKRIMDSIDKDISFITYGSGDSDTYMNRAIQVHAEAVKFLEALSTSSNKSKTFYLGGSNYRKAFTDYTRATTDKLAPMLSDKKYGKLLGDKQKSEFKAYFDKIASKQANVRPLTSNVNTANVVQALEKQVRALESSPHPPKRAIRLAKAKIADLAYGSSRFGDYEFSPTAMGTQSGKYMDSTQAFNMLINPLGSVARTSTRTADIHSQSQRNYAENQERIAEYERRREQQEIREQARAWSAFARASGLGRTSTFTSGASPAGDYDTGGMNFMDFMDDYLGMYNASDNPFRHMNLKWTKDLQPQAVFNRAAREAGKVGRTYLGPFQRDNNPNLHFGYTPYELNKSVINRDFQMGSGFRMADDANRSTKFTRTFMPMFNKVDPRIAQADMQSLFDGTFGMSPDVKPSFKTRTKNALNELLFNIKGKDWKADAQEKTDKATATIARVLPAIAKPIMNLTKSMGVIAAEAGKSSAEAMSAASAIFGNPFEADTLEGIASMGGTMGGLSASTFTNLGGMISGVGEGMGRMANGSVKGGDVADGEKKGLMGKVGSAGGAAISAGLGILGTVVQASGQALGGGWNTAVSLLKSINKATLKIMATSPLFETIKNILNLSFTMVFMPMMNLIQGNLMPLFTQLLEASVKFGNTLAGFINGETLDSITTQFGSVFESIATFFSSHGEELAQMVVGMIGLLPDMIKMQAGFIDLFVNNKDKILDLCKLTIHAMESVFTDKVFDAILEMATYAADLIDRYGESFARTAIAMANQFIKFIDPFMKFIDACWDLIDAFTGMAHGDFSGAGSAAVNFATSTLGMTNPGKIYNQVADWIGLPKLASGGYIPSTPGGVPCIIGEGGEGEYVIPESKMGGITINFSGPVYGMNDFKQQVKNIMNEYTTKASFR